MKQDKFKESIKESLDSYSPDVPDHLWEKVRAGIPAGSAATTAESTASAGSQAGVGIATIGKWIAAAAVVVSVAVWVWPESTNQQETKVATEEVSLPVEDQDTPATQVLTKSETSGADAAADIDTKRDETTATNQLAEESTIAQESESNPAEASGNSASEGNQQTAEQNGSADGAVAPQREETPGATEAEETRTMQVSGATESTQFTEVDQVGGNENVHDEDDHSAEEYPFVECGILADKVIGEAPLTVNFSNISDARSFEWSFDNGTRSDKQKSTVTFDQPGDYEVKLVVTDFAGNRISDKMEIVVLEPSTCFVPNAFSPNGDGLNDYFMVQGDNISDISIEIFRIDGSLVFEGKGLNARWDGADDQQSGNDQYMAVVRFVRNDGTPDIVKTTLKVIRD